MRADRVTGAGNNGAARPGTGWARAPAGPPERWSRRWRKSCPHLSRISFRAPTDKGRTRRASPATMAGPYPACGALRPRISNLPLSVNGRNSAGRGARAIRPAGPRRRHPGAGRPREAGHPRRRGRDARMSAPMISPGDGRGGQPWTGGTEDPRVGEALRGRTASPSRAVARRQAGGDWQRRPRRWSAPPSRSAGPPSDAGNGLGRPKPGRGSGVGREACHG